MATLKKIWWAAAIALLCLPSCLDKGYNSYTFSALGVIQRNAQDSNQWCFMADDSVTFAPASVTKIPSYYRAIAYMEWNSNIAQRDGYSSTVNFTGFEAVTVLPVTAADADYLSSAPDDPVQVSGRVALQYITLFASFSGSDGSKHKFFMLRDSLQTDEPVRLLFRHSRGGDSEYQPLNTIMSFDLETLAEHSTTQDSVRLRLIYSARDSVDFTYRFQR